MDWRQLWEIMSAPDNVPIVGLIPLLIFYIYLAWTPAHATERFRREVMTAVEAKDLVELERSIAATKLWLVLPAITRPPRRNSASRRPVSVSTFWHILMMCLPMPMACGARFSNSRANARVPSINPSNGKTRLTRPIWRASSAPTGNAAMTISFSRPMPII